MPADDELNALLQTPITRLMMLLTRQGVLVREMEQTCLAEPSPVPMPTGTRRVHCAAAVTGRIAFGPSAAHKMLPLRGAMRRQSATRQPLCTDISTAPVCTRLCAAQCTTASGWNSYAATSTGLRFRKIGCSATPPRV